MEHSIASRILYQDEECLIINKLPGEAVQGTLSGIPELPQMLAALTPDSGFLPAAVHRLDVPVSGVCLFARNLRSLSFLNTAFAQGKAEKYYWAVIEKPPLSLRVPETGELVHWIKTDTKRNKSIAYPEKVPAAKEARLQYQIKGYGERYIFMEIKLFTGRHHQIRAQLACLGLHIKGDLKYGSRRSEPAGGIRLHSYSLSFPNPAQPEARLQVTAPPLLQDRLWNLIQPELTGYP